ncbi:hypothetical protein N7540_005527 [Penicillium herquei]|nr:hypothetical protein N7540_005527 [Penicillium herquei]
MSLLNSSIPIMFSQLYLNGAYTAPHSSECFALVNPKDNTLVAEGIPVADLTDVEKAVNFAEAAFNGPWSSFTAIERSACFHRLVALLEEKLPDILYLDFLTTWSPISLIPTREKAYIRNCLLYYAGWTDKQRGDYFPDDDGFIKLVKHEPIGVCVAINPYNSPVASFFIKAAPCLATGNVLIVKPSEKSPLGSLAVAELFAEAGFPPGVVQVLTGDGSTGAHLASHMRVRKVSFTGSVATGKRIQIAAAQSNLKRVTLELGGKSPAVIFEDADIENAVTWTTNGILARTGQPTVFLNPEPDAEIYTDEVFGPVSVIKTFDTEDEVIALANDTEYGLMAGVFTRDINRAMRVSARIDSGVVGVNCVTVMNIQAPFGGKKASGIGREFGEYALRSFTEPKTILIK